LEHARTAPFRGSARSPSGAPYSPGAPYLPSYSTFKEPRLDDDREHRHHEA
jgi:hypothetical protein